MVTIPAVELTVVESVPYKAGYRLAVLMGQRPGTLDAELKPAPVATYAKALPIGDASKGMIDGS